jgi:hypothetical protein
MSTLEGWFENGWLKRHETSPAEIRMQLESADSDLANAEKDLSPAWQFAIAYNAGLRLCSVALLASGYVAERDQKHYRTIAALPQILGSGVTELAGFLDGCRTKRHDVTYESAAAISESESAELIVAVRELRQEVRAWLEREHSNLL